MSEARTLYVCPGDDLKAATGGKKLPALKLADGTVLTHSREILAWVSKQS